MSLGSDSASAVKRALLVDAGVQLVESRAACRRLAESLLLADGPPPVLALSCRRGGPPRHPIVLLAMSVGQAGGGNMIGGVEPPTFLFDLARSPDVLAMGGLQRLFQSAEAEKVFHYGASDAAELADRFAIGWRRVSDVGVAFEALTTDGGQPRRRISLRRLLALAETTADAADGCGGGGGSGGLLPSLSHLREEDEAGHAYWQRRPLTLAMALEAAAGARAVLGVHASAGLGRLWGPLPDLGAYRRAATSVDPGGDWRRRRSLEQAELGAALRLRLAEERGGALALAADGQPLARKLPYGILK